MGKSLSDKKELFILDMKTMHPAKSSRRFSISAEEWVVVESLMRASLNWWSDDGHSLSSIDPTIESGLVGRLYDRDHCC